MGRPAATRLSEFVCDEPYRCHGMPSLHACLLPRRPLVYGKQLELDTGNEGESQTGHEWYFPVGPASQVRLFCLAGPLWVFRDGKLVV